MPDQLKIETDVDVCMGTGVCALTAPAVFTQREDDGTVIVRVATPGAELHEVTQAAAYNCPSGAIRLNVSETP
ncbi:ferredoxin [Amycolatopsis coloradensis]|uniref:Ferredoxin n=1 Tax=Amycolatopsis coloradensis TaxID=76021 RepID=A0ACD5BHC8_9PSEU